jgi:hypothetical protein
MPTMFILFVLVTVIAKWTVVVVSEVIPPPLGDIPPAINASSSTTTTTNIEVVQVYPLPNPEEAAGDPTESFFVSGTNDGYVYKIYFESGTVKTIFTPKDFRPDFFRNETDQYIRELCDGSDLTKENICGRILGIKFEVDKDDGTCKSIWMANAYFGIYMREHVRHPGISNSGSPLKVDSSMTFNPTTAMMESTYTTL